MSKQHKGSQNQPIKPTYHEPAIQAATPEIQERATHWPASAPMPDTYRKPMRQPCPECRRVALDDGGQAVVTMAISGDVVYLRCKACGHRWKLVVE